MTDAEMTRAVLDGLARIEEKVDTSSANIRADLLLLQSAITGLMHRVGHLEFRVARLESPSERPPGDPRERIERAIGDIQLALDEVPQKKEPHDAG